MISIRRIREVLDRERTKFFKEVEPPKEKRGEERAQSVLITDPLTVLASDTAEYHNPYELDFTDFSDPEEIFEIAPPVDEAEVEEALSGEEGDEIRRAIEIKGVDALAWYLPFHIIGVQWGIYIPASSIYYLASDVFGSLDTSFENKLRLAFRILHQHELFHFSVEYMLSQWEVSTGEAFYMPSRRFRDKDLGYFEVEEELANASMYRSMNHCGRTLRVKGRSEILRKFIKEQPPGYNNALESISRNKFDHLCREFVLRLVETVEGPWQDFLDGIDPLLKFPRPPEIDWKQSVLIIIHDEEKLGLPLLDIELFRKIEGFVETDGFAKMLNKLDVTIRKKWMKVRDQLAYSTAIRSLDFKQWSKGKSKFGGNLYSVRINDNFRAHLEWVKAESQWYAIEVGSHKAMGHG